MPDQKSIASGSIFKMADAAGTVFTAIAEVASVGDIMEESSPVDATRLSSLVREYVQGLGEGATLDLRLNLLMDDAMQDELTGVHKFYIDKAPRKFRVKFAGQTKGIEFSAIPVGHGFVGITPNELLKRGLKIKIISLLVPIVNP